MSTRINSANDQNYNILDYKELQEDLALADLEAMDDKEYLVAKFKATGKRPERIAVADAASFGLRKAFWDVYAPVDANQQGTWILEKDADSGEEFIVSKIEQ
jgi:hypothetical protein